MLSAYPLAEVAALLSEPARVAILTALMDGSARPAGELARAAGLSAPAASAHLHRLTEGGMLSVVASGRHRYYRIARAEIATALEALAAASGRPTRAASVAEDPEHHQLRRARTCYDHLAGVLAVRLTRAFASGDVLRPRGKDFGVTPAGSDFLTALGLDVPALQGGSRYFARSCLDWTEREPHIAGALGAALLAELEARRWVCARQGTRALRVTVEGERGLEHLIQAAARADAREATRIARG